MEQLTVSEVVEQRKFKEIKKLLDLNLETQLLQKYQYINVHDIDRTNIADIKLLLDLHVKRYNIHNRFSMSSTLVRGRKTANDIFITPLEVAKLHIDIVDKHTGKNNFLEQLQSKLGIPCFYYFSCSYLIMTTCQIILQFY